ncbi:hypothetical protein BGW80DRAFT_1289586 [Lactifluus volemus]|nr:hypothetical protein BGW80DRAFT_1289586 [Lactifluus volemus]
MLREDFSVNDGISSNSPNDLILAPNPSSSLLRDCLGRKEGRPVLVEPRVRKTSTAGKRPSAPMAFLQRTMARFRRQSNRASLPSKGLTGNQVQRPLSDMTPHLEGCEDFASLTRLVLRSSDDVSFSPSSFFRTVEQVSALNACSGTIPLVPLLPSPPLRPPPSRPRRRLPPSVDDENPARTISTLTPHAPSSLPPKHNSTGSQKIPRKPLVKKKEFDSLLELQALAVELDMNPLDSPPRRLHASPSIKPSCSLWTASPSPALNLDRDPLSELLAVAEELKTMKTLDSDDILYMTDAPPLSPLPPTLHAFLDAPGASLQVLEMDVHSEDETFLGIPIPCIVVTSEGEALPVEVLAMKLPHSSPSEDHLAPPPTTYRGRMEYDQPPFIITPDDGDDHDGDVGRARDSPSEPASSFSSSPCEEEDLGSCSLTSLRDYSECSDANMNLSWEVISDIVSSSSPSNQCSKPDRPTAPKPVPLLRRRERSLLRRMLGGGGHVSALAAGVEKDKRNQVPSPKPERIYLSKEAIGLPRPLSPVSQAVATSQPGIMAGDSPL